MLKIISFAYYTSLSLILCQPFTVKNMKFVLYSKCLATCIYVWTCCCYMNFNYCFSHFTVNICLCFVVAFKFLSKLFFCPLFPSFLEFLERLDNKGCQPDEENQYINTCKNTKYLGSYHYFPEIYIKNVLWKLLGSL